MSEVATERYVPVCEPCIAGEGSECHSPGCAFFLRDVPADGCNPVFAVSRGENGAIYTEVRAERDRAHAQHGPNSMESYPPGAFIRYTILAEEVGEIAKEFNEAEARGGQHTLDLDRVRREAIQVAAMATAWADRIAGSERGESGDR